MSPRKPSTKPTPLDEQILAVIGKWLETRGIPPTVREIQKAVQASSTSVVDYHLRRLERLGYISRAREANGQRTARNIRLLRKPHNVTPRAEEDFEGLAAFARQRKQQTSERPLQPRRIQTPQAVLPIPVAGRIVASEPIPSFPDAFTDETVEVPVSLLPRDTSRLYALEVRGNSMIDALIGDGDIVVLKETKEATNGEMVAVWLKDTNESTLKHFYAEYREGQLTKITLKPANPTMQPIEISNPEAVEVMGKVVLVIRRTDGTVGKPRSKMG